MRTAIVGSRSFMDYDKFKECISIYKDIITEVVSGGAAGADTLAALWASENNIPFTLHAADWKRYGKAAGFIRNVELIKDCEQVIAFLQNNSAGTRHAIGTAYIHNKNVIVINI